MISQSAFLQKNGLAGKLVCIAFLLVQSACSRQPSDSGTRDSVASVAVSPVSIRLSVGQTHRMTVRLADSAGNILPIRKGNFPVIGDKFGTTGGSVRWNSSRPSCATVDPDGIVTALSPGDVDVSATSDGISNSARIVVTDKPLKPMALSPERAELYAGATLQLGIADEPKCDAGNHKFQARWTSSHPRCAAVSSNGLVTALAQGFSTITATKGERKAEAVLVIRPSAEIQGLDFPGNSRTDTTMRFEFKSPLRAYPATYIWRAYPKQQKSYYTAFFWGNNGTFLPSSNYYGFHPYPDWHSTNQHFWEIAAPSGGDYLNDTHVVYDHWYIQVAICQQSGTAASQLFYWDWPDVAKAIRHSGKICEDPPNPVLVIGDAPWNQGNEVWNGILRGFQFYDRVLTQTEIARELEAPGSAFTPWYLCINPQPNNILDRSGNGHHPSWVGNERPALWTAKLDNNTNHGTPIRSK